MNKINWKVRLLNKNFWLAIVPAVLLLAAQVLQIFGIDFDYSQWSATITGIIGTVFMIFAIIGIVSDPTTDNGCLGLSDSEQALTYDEPKQD